MHHLPRRGPFLALALGTWWVIGCAVDASSADATVEEPSRDGGAAADVQEADVQVADASFIDAEQEDAALADAEAVDAAHADAEAGDAAHDDGGSVADSGEPYLGQACDAAGRRGACLHVADCAGASEPVPGYCPGPTDIQCCVPRVSGSCDPLTMPTPNTGLAEAPGEAGCPSGMLRIETFCVDRFEASLVEITAGGEQPWSPYFNPGTRRVRAVSLGGAVPQGYITADQAEAACAEAGKRLCTNTEWLRACQGPQVLTYPYGAQRQAGVCNDARALHPAIELFGTSEPWIWSELDHPCLNQLPDSLALTGAHTGCVTAEGLFDMMGNLHEWTSDPAGTFRGGFYVDTVANGPGCLYATTAHNRLHWDYSTGFRCCAPAP